MRTLFAVLFTSLIFHCHAQVPQGINYQAALRDANGEILANSAVLFRMSIKSVAPPYAIAYQGYYNMNTDQQGLVNFVLGKDEDSVNDTYGSFSSIDWLNSFGWMMQVEVDTGSGTYVSLGEQHLWSVPYAFRAKTAEYATDMYLNDLGNVEITGLVGGEVLQWDGVNEVWKANQLPTAPTQFISFTGKELWYEEWHAEEAIATTPTGVVHVEIGIGLGVSTNSYLGSAYYTPPIGSNVVPLHLPNQSVVTNFTAFRSGNVNVRLYRQNLSNPTAIEEMARVNELDPSSDATINFAMINNESYSYFIFVEPVYHSVPPGSISEFDITGLKVGYTMP